MDAVITIEARLRVELERRFLARPGPLPAALAAEIAESPALLCRQRWGIVRASDLVAQLQPWTERPAGDGSTITKVAGARYTLLLGLIDEPWVQVLVDDGAGHLSAWRGRTVARPLTTVIGTPSDLERLELPRSPAELTELLRRASGFNRCADWMATAALGIDLPALAGWLADLATTHEPAFVALVRRDVRRGTDLLAGPSGRLDPSSRRRLRSLRNLFEVSRLVELMRAMAGARRTTAEDLVIRLADAELTIARLARDDPGGCYLADGWMHMATLRAFRHHAGPALDPAFPLVGYGLEIRPAEIGIATAIRDPATFAFYASALTREEIVAGTTRTLIDISGEQPVDLFCGVELMRLAVVGLRAIARRSGHRSALNYRNRCIIGRLALVLLRGVDCQAFDAYAERWADAAAVRAAELTRRDLEQGLTDPDLTADVGSALVVKTEQVRRLVPVRPESAFDPFYWGRRADVGAWTGYHRVACGAISAQSDDAMLLYELGARVLERLAGFHLLLQHAGDASRQSRPGGTAFTVRTVPATT